MINKLKHIIKDVKIENLLIIFFILQPIIDIYKSFWGDSVSIFGIAIEELINIIFIVFMFIFLMYKIFIINKKKVNVVKYLIYVVLLIIYLIYHYINILKFHTEIYELANINFITENYYIFRVYFLPIVILFLICNSDLSDKEFNKIITYVVLFISSVIVITNIFKISLVSYSLDNVYIEDNIFSWFNMSENANYASYTSKGWFCGTNEISALLLSLSPIIIKQAIKRNNYKYYIVLALQMIAMIMVGTKTAAIGILLLMAVMLVVSVILSILKKEKFSQLKVPVLVILIILFIGFSIYQISPTKLKLQGDKASSEEIRPTAEVKYEEKKDEDISDPLNVPTFLSLSEYIETYSYNYYINDWFIEIYPTDNDIEFWKEIINRDARLNIDNRNFKIEMIERIQERNNNKFDYLLGMGYTSNVPYTERDYYYQYFIFGILGVLLLMGPFIIILLYSGIKTIWNYKEKLNLENLSILLSLGCMIIIGYLAGHVWGMPINMFFMALYAGKLVKNILEKKEK